MELGHQVVVEAPPPDELATGVRVRHGTVGDGEVLGVEADVITVVFDDVGSKQLDRTLVAGTNLLEVTTTFPPSGRVGPLAMIRGWKTRRTP